MTDTLYLRLTTPDADAIIEAVRLDASGHPAAPTMTGTLAHIVGVAPARRYIALIPGAEALETIAKVPKMGGSRLRRSLPYALEDQLVGDIDAQLFASGAPHRHADESTTETLSVPVVVIPRERLQRWQTLLRNAGVEPAAIHLETTCVAAKPGDIVAWLRGDELLLRAPGGAGLVSRIDDLPAALDVLLGSTPRQTLGLQIHATREARQTHEPSVADAASGLARLAWIDASDSTLPWLVSQIPLAEPINLLQGEFAPRRTLSDGARRWRSAAVLGLLILVLHLVDRAWSMYRLAATESRIDAELLSAARSVQPAFTSADEVISTLSPAAAGGGNRGVLQAALADLAAAGIRAGGLRSIALEGAALRVELAAPVAADTLASVLSARGWNARAEPGVDGAVILSLNLTANGASR